MAPRNVISPIRDGLCVCLHAPVISPAADASEERPQEAAPGADGAQGEVKVWGNLVAFVERLDDEMFKSLQVGAKAEGLTAFCPDNTLDRFGVCKGNMWP